MPVRNTFLFELTTSPTNRAHAQPHSFGWSESVWTDQLYPAAHQKMQDYRTERARLLPDEAAIVGVRIQEFTVVNDRLVRGGVSTSKQRTPGASADNCDMPNVSLMLSGTSATANATRFAIRAIPDIHVVRGEYQPVAPFNTRLTRFCNFLGNTGWGFIGADLTQLPVEIATIGNGNIHLVEAAPANSAGRLWTFVKTKDQYGKPVTGTYECISVDPIDNKILIMRNLPATIIAVGGRIKKHIPAYRQFTAVDPVRIVVRKVGRPFDQSRGRASKRVR